MENNIEQVSESDSLYILCVSSQTFSSDEKKNALNQINSSKKIKNILKLLIKDWFSIELILNIKIKREDRFI